MIVLILLSVFTNRRKHLLNPYQILQSFPIEIWRVFKVLFFNLFKAVSMGVAYVEISFWITIIEFFL